jgi:hypothetical protein
MTKKHVIAVHSNGALEFTRHNDLEKMFDGKWDMERVTEVRKDREGGKYFILWMLGPHRQQHHSHAIDRNYFEGTDTSHNTMLFDTYDLAVAHEVKVLNAMRRQGVKIGTLITDG